MTPFEPNVRYVDAPADHAGYQLLGVADPAGAAKDFHLPPLHVYRSPEGKLYFRGAADFAARMEPIPGAWMPNSGARPAGLGDSQLITVQLRHGVGIIATTVAGGMRWTLEGRNDDIIRYKVLR